MRYLAVILALSAALFGAEVVTGNSQIVFQGTISRPDGSPFWGEAKVGIKFFKTAEGNDEISTNNSQSYYRIVKTVAVANGSYSIVIPFDEDQLDVFATLPSGNFYLETYVADLSKAPTLLNDEALFDDKTNDGTADIFTYKLSPRIQVLAAPLALTARGIYMDLGSAVWKVGEDFAGNKVSVNNVPPNSMVVANKVSIGTVITTNAMLSVVSVEVPDPKYDSANAVLNDDASINKTAIYISDGNLINNSTTISATAVWHARWQ